MNFSVISSWLTLIELMARKDTLFFRDVQEMSEFWVIFCLENSVYNYFGV
jgi:hypothetical protein